MRNASHERLVHCTRNKYCPKHRFRENDIAETTTRRRRAFCFSSLFLFCLSFVVVVVVVIIIQQPLTHFQSNSIRTHNMQTIKQRTVELLAHERKVNSLDFNLSGEYLASGSVDQTIRVWDAERALSGGGNTNTASRSRSTPTVSYTHLTLPTKRIV